MRVTKRQLRRIVRESLLGENLGRAPIQWPPGAWSGPHLRSASGETLDDVALVVINAIDSGAVDLADEDAIQELIDTQLGMAGILDDDLPEWDEQVWSRLPETF